MVNEDPIGRYRLTERLGTGAFATVWLGYDDDLDAPVAIKVLADNWASDADVHARFVAEARLLRRVRDQRVVRVHDIGTLPDGRPYFVMDYADGGTVAELIADGQRLAPRDALRLGAEIARAAQVLHDHGFAHRDIKPGNLLLTTDLGRPGVAPNVVIADLGMAKSLSEASGYTVTVGTPAYMAPEQALGLGFDQRADVYGVAAVTYTLLAGRPPFRGAGLVEIAERSRTELPPRLGLDPGGTVDDALADALAFDPERRPASATELAAVLDRLADRLDQPGAPDVDTVVRPTVRLPESAPEPPTVLVRPDLVDRPTATEVIPADRPASLAAHRTPVAAHRPSVAGVVAGAAAVAVLVALVTWVLLSFLG